jgi:hypothetical protein
VRDFDPNLKMLIPVDADIKVPCPIVNEEDVDRRTVYEKQRENDEMMKTAMLGNQFIRGNAGGKEAYRLAQRES